MGIIVGDEPGNVESRKAERVTANFSVTFREIDEQEAETLAELKSGGDGGAGAVATASPQDSAAVTGGAKTENISQGGISFTGDLQLLGERKLEKGKKLLVEFALPGESAPVSAVAVVAWSIEGKGEHGKFTAGLMFTGIEPVDLDKIQHYVEGQGKA